MLMLRGTFLSRKTASLRLAHRVPHRSAAANMFGENGKADLPVSLGVIQVTRTRPARGMHIKLIAAVMGVEHRG